MQGLVKTSLIAGALLVSGSLAGCSTWDSMSTRDKGTAIGAGAGAVLGGSTVGGTAGTVGGAVVGGAAGRYIGREQEDKERREAAERQGKN